MPLGVRIQKDLAARTDSIHAVAALRRGCPRGARALHTVRNDIQLDFHTAMAFQLAPERLHRPIRQILPRGFGGERRVSANRQRNSRPLRSSKPEFIV